MASLLAVFAQFEREILRERVRASLAHARQNGKRLGRPQTAALQTSKYGNYTVLALARPRSPAGCRSGALRCAESWQQSREKTEERPDPETASTTKPSWTLRAGRASDELVLPR